MRILKINCSIFRITRTQVILLNLYVFKHFDFLTLISPLVNG